MSDEAHLIDILDGSSEAPRRIGQLIWSEAPQTSLSSYPMAFRYDGQWLRHGFALGDDLPLTADIHYPRALPPGLTNLPRDRATHFGFVMDLMPGAWIHTLGQKTDLNDLKCIAGALPSAQPLLWTFVRQHPFRFTALTAELVSGELSASWNPIEPEPVKPRTVREFALLLEDAQGPRALTAASANRLLAMAAAFAGHTPKLWAAAEVNGKPQVLQRYPDQAQAPNRVVWHAVTQALAQACGVPVCPGKLLGHTLYAQDRFDQDTDGKSLFCLSAASLVGLSDPTLAVTRTTLTYLDIADILNREGHSPKQDLEHLFARALFNTLTGNNETLEHIWFARHPHGWRLLPMTSPLATVPVAGVRQLAIAVAPNAGSDVDALLQASRYFGITPTRAKAMRLEFANTLAQFKRVAEQAGADFYEISAMQPAFVPS